MRGVASLRRDTMGAMARRRDPVNPFDVPPAEPMQTVLDRVVKSMGAPSTDAVDLVFNRWSEVVGAQLGQRTRPVGLADGTLTIAADDPATVSHVRYLEAELCERLTELLGHARVTRVDVKVDRASRRRAGR